MAGTTIKFTKMHGLGNDFVVIDNTHEHLDWKMLPATQIADRHLGIGCDQILLIESSTEADFFCRIINSDGSEAEQCGNGLRCVGRYIHENGLHQTKQFTIATVAGIYPIQIMDYNHIRITIPSSGIRASVMELTLPVSGATINGRSLSVGNPHFIIKVNDILNTQTNQIGREVSTHTAFPQGTNVGFMQVLNPGHIRLRTYERGAGETHACGSNACAAVASGILDGSLQHQVTVEFNYGQLAIEWEGKDKPVHMTGPASYVFSGEYRFTR